MITLAQWIVAAAGLYFAIGLLFAFFFAFRGVNRIDEVARESTWGFRLIIIPGVTALWPLMLRRWVGGSPPPVERSPHRKAPGGGS